MALRIFSTNNKFAVIKEVKKSTGPSGLKIIALFGTEKEANEYYNSLPKSDSYFVESINNIKQHNPDIVNLKVGTYIKSSHKRTPFRLFSDNKISSDKEFRDYAHNVMKQAHKDNYSEETTDKVVDDLLKDNPDADYGELVGRLTSGFGK